MKVTDIVTESNSKSIANEAVPFIPLAAAGARMAAPAIARGVSNLLGRGAKPATDAVRKDPKFDFSLPRPPANFSQPGTMPTQYSTPGGSVIPKPQTITPTNPPNTPPVTFQGRSAPPSPAAPRAPSINMPSTTAPTGTAGPAAGGRSYTPVDPKSTTLGRSSTSDAPRGATKGEIAAGTALGLGSVAGGAAWQLGQGREPTPSAATTSTKSQTLGSSPMRYNASTPPTSPAATVAPSAPAARTAPPRPAGGPQQGVVGSQLAALSGGEFATRADRTNQEKVDAILGTGYKAGSAAANTALRDYYKANPPQSDAQRQELVQQIFNQNMERARQLSAQQQAANARQELERDNPRLRTEPTGSAAPAAGSAASFTPAPVPPAPVAAPNGQGTPVKSGTGQTWTDSSGQPIVTMPEEKNSLMRLLKLSGQKH